MQTFSVILERALRVHQGFHLLEGLQKEVAQLAIRGQRVMKREAMCTVKSFFAISVLIALSRLMDEVFRPAMIPISVLKLFNFRRHCQEDEKS